MGELDLIPGDIESVRGDADDSEGMLGHNSYRVSAQELRAFVERLERLDSERKDIADQVKEVRAEARGRGYDVKIINKLLAIRKRDSDEVAEEDAVLEMYKEALGMV